eukprot:gene9-9606_t
MEHLDLAISTDQESVYSSNDEAGNPIMSERVSSLAAAIYGEFENLIQNYGQGILDTLMPMVVNVLEQLDTTYNEMREQTLELEMLSEDNEQLINQYEREKQLRKLAESKYLEYEDAQDQEKGNLQASIESLEFTNKQHESRIKSLLDQIERTEERFAESKREYSSLHTRHTEMIHMYMERMEHYRRMTAGLQDASPFVRKQLPEDEVESKLRAPPTFSAEINEKTGKKIIDTDQYQLSTEKHEKGNELSFEYENKTGLEKQDFATKSSSSRRLEMAQESASTASKQSDTSETIEHIEVSDSNHGEENIIENTPDKAAVVESVSGISFTEETLLDRSEHVEQQPVLGESSDNFRSSTVAYTETPENLSSIDDVLASQLSLDSSRLGTLQDQRRLNVPAAQRTAELDSSVNDVSLFTELSKEEPSILGDMSRDFLSPMDTGLESLIKENEELLDSKTKLQTQKNDLLQKVEEISREKEILEDHVSDLAASKSKVKKRCIELEQELKKLKHELDKASFSVTARNGEDRVSSANRKRFTRVEMARVLMERNQYKERLMELQEAVRWTEMISFNNLFAGSTGGPPTPQTRGDSSQINVWSTQGQSPLSQHRRSISVLGVGSPYVECITEKQRKERKERYKHVKEHINTEGRKQAYGWSLPANFSKDQEIVTVPIPVYCRPLNTDPAMKIWCCAGISTYGGRKSDGSFVGLKADVQEPSPSTVWIGTSTHSCSKVTILDANTPSNAIDQFIVCSSHLLCMAAVPGVSNTDLGFEENHSDKPHRKYSENIQGSRPPIGARSYSYGSGTEMRSSLPRRKAGSQDVNFVGTSDGNEATGILTGVQAEEEIFPEEDSIDEGVSKVTSALPTMWLGAQSGKIYVHSSIVNWKKCLQSGKLRDSVLSIVEVRGRVMVALADGTVAIFHRKPDGRWDLSNYHLLDLGRPHHSIRCMTVVHETVWCGYRNKVQIINPKTMSIEQSFDAHPRRESQVRQLACVGDGVWVSIRLDSTLRLYNARTYHHLQDVDIEPYVSKMLGTGSGYSYVRITALLLSRDRLWVGTGNGVILSIPLVAARGASAGSSSNEGSTSQAVSPSKNVMGFMPYCSMIHAQLSFHGHRDSVKFFVSVNCAKNGIAGDKAHVLSKSTNSSSTGKSSTDGVEKSVVEKSVKPTLIISGGEGYIDFRVGDDDSDETKFPEEGLQLASKTAAAERSHLLVWQINS